MTILKWYGIVSNTTNDKETASMNSQVDLPKLPIDWSHNIRGNKKIFMAITQLPMKRRYLLTLPLSLRPSDAYMRQ